MADDALVGIVMGSDSDWPVMAAAAQALREFGVPHEVDVVSAHRQTREMLAYGCVASRRGLRVITAGGGAASPRRGMPVSLTVLPVIGVPVRLMLLDGVVPLLSTVQMPAGLP